MTSHRHIQVLLYKQNELWAARALQFNLVGYGTDKGSALEELVECIRMQVTLTHRFNSQQNLDHPAESRFYKMFQEGEHFERSGHSNRIFVEQADFNADYETRESDLCLVN